MQPMSQGSFDEKEPNMSTKPGEAVEYGAAEQRNPHKGEDSSQAQDLLLLDATPLPMSLETAGT